MQQRHAKLYLEHLDRVTDGREPEIQKVESTHQNLNSVYVFIYLDWPHTGIISGFTFGLSEASHPEWKLGRPELMISVESADRAWPYAIGYMAEKLRGHCPFCYGSTISFHAKISEESKLDAFLIFAPPHLYKVQQSVSLNNFTCHITGMWPMYASEIEIYNKMNLQDFWHHNGWAPMNIKRPPITSPQP